MTRLLFVDDEANVLQGLRRMLRAMRKDWEMHFVESGPAALALLDRAEFDVVVTDMRMPGMNGAELLDHVRTRHPATARIILSGYAEQASAIRSVAAAHQFLAKPCDAETLRETVRRTCQMRDLLHSAPLREVAARIGQMPSIPEVYERVNAEMAKEEPSLAAIASIVAEDLGMTAKLLQLVNSAFFGLRRHISSIDHAVAYLGIDVIRSLVLSESAFKRFDGRPSGISAESLIRRGYRVGHLAKAIGRFCTDDQIAIDEAFQAGVMHELGKLILASEMPVEYRQVADGVARGVSQDEAEGEVFGVTSAEVGAYLLGLWGLSDGIVEAIAFLRRPSMSQVARFSPLVALHAAAAFESSSSLSLDDAWLESLGLAGQIPDWRVVAERQPNERDAA